MMVFQPRWTVLVYLLLGAVTISAANQSLLRPPSAAECRKAASDESKNHCATRFMQRHCKAVCDEQHRQRLLEKNYGYTPEKSFYDLKAVDLYGVMVHFKDFVGRVVLITNVASYCEHTDPYYEELNELYEELNDGNGEEGFFEILAFPCNQFGGQEPDSSVEIAAFCEDNDVEFRVMDKIDVNGAKAHPVYKYLKSQVGQRTIQWNFSTFFLVDSDGQVRAMHNRSPRTVKPLLKRMVEEAMEEYE